MGWRPPFCSSTCSAGAKKPSSWTAVATFQVFFFVPFQSILDKERNQKRELPKYRTIPELRILLNPKMLPVIWILSSAINYCTHLRLVISLIIPFRANKYIPTCSNSYLTCIYYVFIFHCIN